MYKYASNYLKANGYEHYEISSYAKLPSNNNNDINNKNNINTTGSYNPNRSRHNQIYWGLDTQWYAFGLGSTSYINQQLISRPKTLSDYNKWVNDQVLLLNQETDIVPTNDINDITLQIPNHDMMLDIVLKRLRTSEGLSLHWINERFTICNEKILGEKYIQAIIKGIQLGIDLKLVIYDKKNQILQLTDPDGFLFSNSIISNVFMEMDNIDIKES